MNKVAVIGAGRWGQNIIRTLAALNALGPIVEADVSRGQQLADLYQVPYFSTVDRLLDSDLLTPVAIATTAVTHYSIARQVLATGRDVFIEKPMCFCNDEANQLVALATSQACILMVGHLLLYQPAIPFIKNFLQTGRLGRVYSIHQTRKGLGTVRKEENVLLSLGVHDLAVLSYLLQDNPCRIAAHSQSIINEQIADTMWINFEYPSSIQAQIELSWIWPVKERRLMIIGEQGALQFDEIKQEVSYFDYKVDNTLNAMSTRPEVIFAETAEPLLLELRHFLDCIATRNRPRSDGQQGADVMSLVAQVERKHRGTADEPLFCS